MKASYGMLAVAVLVAIGAVGIAFLTTTQERQEADQVAVVTNDAAPASFEIGDADGDGVPDWKEILWGTDPHNPDSDGDGTTDGDEIAAGTNPTRVGTEPITQEEYRAPQALPPSEALARELFAGYAEAQTNDGTVTASETNTLTSSLIERHLSPAKIAPQYTLSDLFIDKNESIIVYNGTLLAIFSEADAISEYELAIFTRALDSGATDELEKLLFAASVYQNITDRLLTMRVPEGLAVSHLAVVNDLSTIATATDELALWNGDPLDGLSLVNNFAAAEAELTNSVAVLYTLINNLE